MNYIKGSVQNFKSVLTCIKIRGGNNESINKKMSKRQISATRYI